MMFALAWLPGEPVMAAPWYYAGAIVLICGIAVALVASRQFAVVGTNIVPLTRSSSLVTNGAFALTRNPMYIGMVLALIGTALLLNRAVAVAGAVRLRGACCTSASSATKKR